MIFHETSLFQLGPLPNLDAKPYTNLDLPTIRPAWHLPDLDEHAAGSERLLKGLEDLRSGMQPQTPSRKGKERAVSSYEGPVVSSELPPTELDWERLGGDEDGTAQRPLFEVR